jgi:hypothetical protein
MHFGPLNRFFKTPKTPQNISWICLLGVGVLCWLFIIISPPPTPAVSLQYQRKLHPQGVALPIAVRNPERLPQPA